MVNVGRMPGSRENLHAWSVEYGVKGPVASAHRLAVCGLYVLHMSQPLGLVHDCNEVCWWARWVAGTCSSGPAVQALSAAAPSMF